MPQSRRNFLLGGAALGCTAAASPLITPIALASAPWDARLVVIILRGAMDGLDVLRPTGDANFAGLRQSFGSGAQELDGFFSLHPKLAGLLPLWHAGELGFAHAVATPYRDKRSHFDGQDILEAGTAGQVPTGNERTGWLNRLLQTHPGMSGEMAFAVGLEEMLVLEGPAPFTSWSPDSRLRLTPQSQRLLAQIYHDDAVFSAAAQEAFDLVNKLAAERGGQMMAPARRSASPEAVAWFVARRLKEATRIAAFSLTGWDTHHNQRGGLGAALERLRKSIMTLRAGLGPIWSKTAVLAMTEFGRTARENGTRGTDHGTGGCLFMAGGALRGGKVYGRWPGLDEAALYARRDLMPTADVRAYAAAAMRGLFGLDRALLESTVFPSLDMSDVPDIVV